jgi:hypothetical protein
VEPLQETTVHCPYCGESIGILIDCSSGAQEYVEDCQVCCQPMVMSVSVSADGDLDVEVRRENP